MDWLKKAIVTGLGTGYLPVAPGTWGSAAVVGIFLAVAAGSDGRAHCVAGTMAIVAVLSSVGCVRLGRFAEQTFGKRVRQAGLSVDFLDRKSYVVGYAAVADFPVLIN